MQNLVPLETAKQDLDNLLGQLNLGESVTLTNERGRPVALLVSLKQPEPGELTPAEWEAKWDALAKEVDRAWKSEKSAVEIVSEMRR